MNKFLKQSSNSEFAEEIVTKALTYLANEPQIFSRFLSLTGLEPDEIRSQVNFNTFQSAVLEFLLSDEAFLLTFCSNSAIDPMSIKAAYHAISQDQHQDQ